MLKFTHHVIIVNSFGQSQALGLVFFHGINAIVVIINVVVASVCDRNLAVARCVLGV